ncbi:unnamed protein product [Didymodactylos carnosus]|uniref:Uncharacterized protein n=1 Tax=Didymodactylos carnosus TaxID=1234261 RepID=A0A814YW39_9BILA|nr:unnamed protein product [Didymodactylos carnosus]CAF3996627.1 unnamed protein product [Didymodactylos carnosus]
MGGFPMSNLQGKHKNTPLVPFWVSKEDGKYLTSVELEFCEKWEYTYPETEWSMLLPSYATTTPMEDSTFGGIHWYLNLLNVPKPLANGSFEIRVFINLPNANIRTPLKVPNYAGCVSVFARPDESECVTCRKITHFCGSVKLTPAMKNLGILTDSEISPEMAVEVINPNKMPMIAMYNTKKGRSIYIGLHFCNGTGN